MLVATRVICFTSSFMPAASRASTTSVKFFWRCGNFDLVIARGLDIQSAVFEGDFHDLFFARPNHGDQAAAFEEIGHAATATQVATVNIEDLANFRGRAVAVVGHDFAHDGDAGWAIAFVDDFFDVATVEFAGTLLDSAFDVFARAC